MNQGDLAQFKLIPLLSEQGFEVSIPCNSHCVYDLVVDNGTRLLKVQVKSCDVLRRNRYKVDIMQGADRNKHVYPAGSFDFFIIHIFQANTWYVIPFGAVQGIKWVSLYPHDERGKYDKYREHWELLREEG